MTTTHSLIALILSVVVVHGNSGNYPSTFYGFIPVEPKYNSLMFYGIRTTVPAPLRSRVPLVFFLQGGPGATSLFSDYLETGPQKLIMTNATPGYALVERRHSWAKHATMVYIDNPIGTGFSYTNSTTGFATSDQQIANTLVNFTSLFLQRHPEYRGHEMWIFCESYGGKMTAYFGAALGKAVLSKKIALKFRGVALGDGWVDPVGCMYSYGKYLKTFSQLSEVEVKNVTAYADLAAAAVLNGNGSLATFYWGVQQDIISFYTANINWYNDMYYYDYTADNVLNTFLGTNFTKMLGKLLPSYVQYNAQSNEVFSMMNESFMIDAISQVDELLAMGFEVNVYSGQLDLIVDVLCIEGWMKKLRWISLSQFLKQPRVPIYENNNVFGNVAAFTQQYKNLRLWNIMKAGHMVPLDQPWTAETMFATIIGTNSSVPSADPQQRSTVHSHHVKHRVHL